MTTALEATTARKEAGQAAKYAIGASFYFISKVLTSGKLTDENFRTAQVKTAWFFGRSLK
jgi:hypothetical protein